MDDIDIQVLQDNRLQLMKDMDPIDILQLLKQCGIINVSHCDDVKSGKTRRERSELLLDMLERRGPDALKCFIDALHKTTPHLAVALRDNQAYPFLHRILECYSVKNNNTFREHFMSYTCP